MRYTFRPLGAWTEGNTPNRRSRYTFKAPWSDTITLLGRELEHLDARNVVLQADVAESDIRLDGMLRANARVGHPGIRIAFDSRFGPLTYATDSHERWEHNVRAIALGLQALRAVDRYGVTKRGEQYTGWKALPGGTPTDSAMTVEDAARFMADHADPDVRLPHLVSALIGGRSVGSTYRTAARRLHPDTGGDKALFQRLQDAKRLLDARAGGGDQ